MNKKTIRDIELTGKRVLMRVDFNVPLTDEGEVGDDTRIRAALPTIEHVLAQEGTALVLMSHLGRPKGAVKPEFSLKPAADHLATLIDATVKFSPDCVGDAVESMAADLEAGEVLVLENLRFHPEEEGKTALADDATDEEKAAAKAAMKKNQDAFAAKLAKLGDVYVSDAFGTAHRAHASMAVVTKYMDECVAGFLLERELEYIGGVLEAPAKPFVAIIGGAKISGKIDVVTNLMEKCDTILIGGGMTYTFYKAQGREIGNSLVEEDKVELASKIMADARARGVKLMLPTDNVLADDFSADANIKGVEGDIDDGWMALDIGPKTIEAYCAVIADAKTVIWNGPMGCFEMAPFAGGTFSVCQAVADADCISVIGGGDSVSAVKKSGLADKMSHISTGGGASLEFMEGKQLPGIVALSDKA